MRRLMCIAIVLAGTATGAMAGEGKVRFWTDNTGNFAVKAQLAQVDQLAGIIWLKTNEGERVRVPLKRLSAADNQWLKNNNHLGDAGLKTIAGIDWFSDLNHAQKEAAGSDKSTDDKPIMCFRALGELSGFM